MSLDGISHWCVDGIKYMNEVNGDKLAKLKPEAWVRIGIASVAVFLLFTMAGSSALGFIAFVIVIGIGMGYETRPPEARVVEVARTVDSAMGGIPSNVADGVSNLVDRFSASLNNNSRRSARS